MVRAVDMQQVLLQSHTSEKVQQTLQQHPDRQQRYFELHLQEEKKLLKEKVQDPEEVERAIIHEREERDGRRDAREDNPGEQQETDRPAAVEEGEEGHHINIRI
ncbi:MAG: hypothetical protein A4E73_02279 [Syntrophaceae bacterium PtaU1.Bin231]|nr:MAG: hypothetical protein A4E73_02279 [Syntrophaceae bacterium PtaU1.Bin231]